MKLKKLLIPSLLVLGASAVTFSGTFMAGAVTTTNVSRAIQLNRLRMGYADINAVPNSADPGGVCGGFAKRVVLETVPAGGEINAIVTKARTAFSGPNVDEIGVVAVRAEQNGVQVSAGDIAAPNTDLKDVDNIENSFPNSGEIAYYDENDPWDVAVYFCGRNAASDPIDINGLTRGQVDFYITETK